MLKTSNGVNKRHRIFIAINLPNEIKKHLAAFQKKWADVPAKWTTIENLHITLLFLGEATDQDLGQVCQTVKEVAKNHSTFNIRLDRVAYGPEGKLPPRYIWAGSQEVPQAVLLKKDLENALFESIKFKIDKNIFNAHITLARIKEWEWRAIEPEERPEVAENIDLTFTVESVEIMESELTREGPRYTIVESHQLQ